MRHEIISMPSAPSFEVTSASGQELVEAAEAKLDNLPVVRALLQNLKAAHLPSYYHCLRVGEVASSLAEDAADTDSLFISGVLHDIGKSYPGIPELLDKPGKLTTEQIQVVHIHSAYGMDEIVRVLKQSAGDTTESQDLARAAFVAYYHHTNCEELEQLQSLEGGVALDADQNELEYRKSLAQIVHLVDQIDARTDITRPYLLAEETRQNIGVQRSATQLFVEPELLWGEITEDFYGKRDTYNRNQFAQQFFVARFGSQLALAG